MVVLAFVSALASGLFYWNAAKSGDRSQTLLARRLFYLQAFSVVAVFTILFAIIFNHRYEYFYAWRHSSNSLPVYYMISCFWEGQEGSFLLWLFWNAVLGVVVTRTAGKFESPVMAVICLAQIALGTMLLGLHFGDYHIGSSPFDLLRDVKPELLSGIPSAEGKAMYLKAVTDGNGLNPLLQNYWMVIHPPTLFLGFATVLVPFAYSIAGLWQRNEREWLSPALIWSLVSVGILGLGIIMGGFWAYESLTFGGYWAWDPVENASLMPWLIMASAAHMLLISKSTGRHLFSAHLLIQLSFWLVLYATFLTRSGILGETSVHSFTDLGLSGQLLLFLFGFMVISFISTAQGNWPRWILLSFLSWVLILIGLGIGLDSKTSAAIAPVTKVVNIVLFAALTMGFLYSLFQRTKSSQEDEKWTSREFWMFVGAMFLILSLVQVFSATSIPVFNKLFGSDTAVPKEDTYNRIQLWLAMPVMILMAVGQWFRYRETPVKELLQSLLKLSVIALLLTILLAWGFGISQFKYLLFLFVGVCLFTGNVLYFGRQKRMPWLSYGASVAHAGFGILLIGVLVSSVTKNIITGSNQGIGMASEVDEKGRLSEQGVKFNRENRILYKNKTTVLAGYEATFRGSEKGKNADSISKYFEVLFVKRDKAGRVTDSFVLHPKAQNNPNMGLISEPSTRHYLHKDVFTHINHESSLDREEPFAGFKSDTVKIGQTFLTQSGKTMLTLDSVSKLHFRSYLVLQYHVTANNLTDTARLQPLFVRDTTGVAEEPMPAQSDELGVLLRAEKVHFQDSDLPATFVFLSAERSPRKEYVVLKAIEFPWINLVWSGTIIMVLGFVMAVVNRLRQHKALN